MWLYRSVYDIITNSSLLTRVSIFSLSSPLSPPPPLVCAEIYGFNGQTCCSVGHKFVFVVPPLLFGRDVLTTGQSGVCVCVAASFSFNLRNPVRHLIDFPGNRSFATPPPATPPPPPPLPPHHPRKTPEGGGN